MKNQELSRRYHVIDDLFKKTKVAVGDNIEMQSHWAKYLCILSAGFLETALSEIYIEFSKTAASEPVANYTLTSLSKIQNPNMSKFIEVAASFKKKWGSDLELFVSDEGRKEAIDSIMANRHKIAHGKDSRITVAGLRRYLEKSIEVIDYSENQCKK